MHITDNDRTRLAEAIAAAERQTSGEIFCVVARRISTYVDVSLAWAAAMALQSRLSQTRPHPWEAPPARRASASLALPVMVAAHVLPPSQTHLTQTRLHLLALVTMAVQPGTSIPCEAMLARVD